MSIVWRHSVPSCWPSPKQGRKLRVLKKHVSNMMRGSRLTWRRRRGLPSTSPEYCAFDWSAFKHEMMIHWSEVALVLHGETTPAGMTWKEHLKREIRFEVEASLRLGRKPLNMKAFRK
jgi:hypothetical protein